MEKNTTIEQTVQKLNSAYQKRESLKAEINTKKTDLAKDEKQQIEIEKSISNLQNTLKNLINEE
jgi:outer membrane protein TolC